MVEFADVVKTEIKKEWLELATKRREAVDAKWGIKKMKMWGTPERRELGYLGELVFANQYKLDIPGEMVPDGHYDFLIRSEAVNVPSKIGIDVKTSEYPKTFGGAFNNPNWKFQILASQIELYNVPGPIRALASIQINKNRTLAYIVGWILSSDVHLGPARKTEAERAGYWKVSPKDRPAYYRIDWWRLKSMKELMGK